MDWILKLPEGHKGDWIEYWSALIGKQVRSTSAGILEGIMFSTGSAIRGDYAGSPTTSRFMHDYNLFIDCNPNCEPVRRFKLAKVYVVTDLAEIGKKIVRLVEETKIKKQRVRPLTVGKGKAKWATGFRTVKYTRSGYDWSELAEILRRFFFAKFAEDNGYKIIEWG